MPHPLRVNNLFGVVYTTHFNHGLTVGLLRFLLCVCVRVDIAKVI